MFEPREVVYAYVTNIHPPKYKYFITIYRDDELRIVTCFTTTKNRLGIPFEQLQHGYVYENQQYVGYCYAPDVEVGFDEDKRPFKFPRKCVVPFDYGVREAPKEKFLELVRDGVVVCKLHLHEYENLVYAMYKSPRTNPKYKPYLEKVLQKLYA